MLVWTSHFKAFQAFLTSQPRRKEDGCVKITLGSYCDLIFFVLSMSCAKRINGFGFLTTNMDLFLPNFLPKNTNIIALKRFTKNRLFFPARIN
jgi:hypothetical protein